MQIQSVFFGRVTAAVSIMCLLFSCGAEQSQSDASSNTQEQDQAQESEMPNIVLVVGDDQGAPYFGFMGADYVETPRMDEFSKTGVLFTDGYVPENHCRPSLQTLLTGILPPQYAQIEAENKAAFMEGEEYAAMSDEEKADWEYQYQYHAMKDMHTLPRILAEQGYHSFQGGKWWEYNYQNGGFSHGMTKGWNPHDKVDSEWFLEFMGGDGTDLARVSNEPAYEFIRENKDDPFFIWYAPSLPHYPFDAPDKYYSIYADQDMSESAKKYYANCTWFDDAFGQLIDFMKAEDEFENTLFIYVNDNGWDQEPKDEYVGDEMRFHNGGDKGKLANYDLSYRSPIIFSWQGKIEAGVVREDIISSADIPATVLDYLGLDIPDHYYGHSLKSYLEGGTYQQRDGILGLVHKVRSTEDMMGRDLEAYWIRSPQWFFTWNMTDGIKALYDVKNDRRNDHDVSADHPDLIAEYTQKVEAWKADFESH
jgi:uncharacterized sulfatase